MTENDIVAGCKRGQPEAVHALVDLNYRRVFRVALSLVSDEHQAEDLTQETFAASLKAIHAFRGGSSLFTWLVGILRRQSMNRRRSERRLKIVADVGETAAGAEDEERRYAREELRGAFERMDAESRLILGLFHVEELKYEQIAEALQIPIGTVKSRLFDARRKLKSLIEGRHAV